MKHPMLTLILLLWIFSANASPLIYAEQHTLHSKALASEKAYYVHLPEGYQESTRKYPVLFLLHGQWDTLPAVATLALLGDEIPQLILVGVQGSGADLLPGSDTQSQTPYSHFLNDELLPLIAANYRSGSMRILSGHSNSGRFVMNEWLRDGQAFSAYYAFSPSIDDGQLSSKLSTLDDASISAKAPLTLTLANEGEHMQHPFEQITARLQAVQAQGFRSTHLSDQSHSSSRHASLMFALRGTFYGWQPGYETKTGPFPALEQHYRDFGARLGFDAEISQELLQKLSAYFAMQGTPEGEQNTALTIEHGIKRDTKNSEGFWEIADYLRANDNPKAAETIATSLCRTLPQQPRCSHYQGKAGGLSTSKKS
ncbi:alpha/beta hydrolase [Shewanella sedimentimangrovi]|uniref:Esterase n=1 Tax=Shewanella sedimentimangrovi TaxID=2814293 RepID=A0ABX7R1F3_9GAMM|nr:alpha/beta hydrolase-fold protein [Shewanella sedimentimangrovi]QSX37016.1 esterase [Shewanella sedimentimangrovi]